MNEYFKSKKENNNKQAGPRTHIQTGPPGEGISVQH